MQRPVEFREEYNGFTLIARYDTTLRQVWSVYVASNEGAIPHRNWLVGVSHMFALELGYRDALQVGRVDRYNDTMDFAIINGREYGKIVEFADRGWTVSDIMEDLRD